jgi:hypothetical protein
MDADTYSMLWCVGRRKGDCERKHVLVLTFWEGTCAIPMPMLP